MCVGFFFLLYIRKEIHVSPSELYYIANIAYALNTV